MNDNYARLPFYFLFFFVGFFFFVWFSLVCLFVCFTCFYYHYSFYALEKEGEEKENEISYKCCDLNFLYHGYFYVHFYTSL